MNSIEQARDVYGKFTGQPFRKFQRETIEAIANSTKRVVVVKAPTGCHAYGQKILMHNGSLKAVQNVRPLDRVMGPDGYPRIVCNLIRNKGEMVNIVPTKGKPFKVNLDHVLTLVRSNDGTKQAGKLVDISVRDYLGKNKGFKAVHKLARTGIDFSQMYQRDLALDPYILGVLLGDGMLTNQVGVSNADYEVVDELYDYAKRLGLEIRKSGISYYFKKAKRDCGFKQSSNTIKTRLQELGLYGHRSGDKFIPREFLTSSRENRLELLAGLIDTDGYLSNGSYDYVTKSSKLCDDILFLCRSLGLAAYSSVCIKSCQNNFSGTYHRISISGNLDAIPCRVARRKAGARRQNKNHLVTGFAIKPAGYGNYYGFTLSGDGRYLLDDFTITHNSGKSIIGMVTGELETKFAYLCSSKSLQDQINKDFGKEVKLLKGRSNYPCTYIPRNNAGQCINSPSTPCPAQHKCAYKLQKRAVDAHPRQVLNYPYVMTEFNYVGSMNGGEPYPLMIADEADVLESIISSFVSLPISNQAISKYGLKRPPFKTFSEVNVTEWLSWARGLQFKLKPKLDYLGESISEATGMQPYELLALQREQQELTSLLAKVGIFANNVDKTWAANISDRQAEFKPLWLRESLAEQYYWRHARKHVLLSATWPDPDIIARTLGLPIGDIDMIDVPSTFPVGANPVHLCNVGDMSRKTITTATPKILDAIETLLNHHSNHKGVIHTGNYEVCRAIMATGNPRLIAHDQFNKQAQIDKFVQSNKPLVFVSPSSTRGLDLPGDLCRFTITAKAPYQSLGDSFVAGRTYSKPLGQRWFTSCCAQEIEQGVGRGMRSQDDWCENYILDIAACKLIAGQRSMFGEYFNQSVKFKTI